MRLNFNKAWRLFVKDKGGVLDRDTFHLAINHTFNMKVDRAASDKFFARYDKDGDGQLSQLEFRQHFLERLIPHAHEMPINPLFGAQTLKLQMAKRPRHSRIMHRQIFGHGCDLDGMKIAHDHGELKWANPPDFTPTLNKGTWPMPASRNGGMSGRDYFPHTKTDKIKGMTYKDLDALLAAAEGPEKVTPQFEFERTLQSNTLRQRRSRSTPLRASDTVHIDYNDASDRYFNDRHVPLSPKGAHNKTCMNDAPWPTSPPNRQRTPPGVAPHLTGMLTNVGHPLTGHGQGTGKHQPYGTNITRHVQFP